MPSDAALCRSLADAVRDPDALPLGDYEQKLAAFFGNWCHRDTATGWVRDKRVRDAGPFVSIFRDGEWHGSDHGTHAPVVIWYSPEMAAWVRANRGLDDDGPGPDGAPVPDGAMMVKEMFAAPASRCAGEDLLYLWPENGAAIMVRDAAAARDGWFWGWFGWSGQGWSPDWPALPEHGNRLAYMGFGQYCTNCHASARDNMTYASVRNMQGGPGAPLVYLSQDEALRAPPPTHHAAVAGAASGKKPTDGPLIDWRTGWHDAFPRNGALPTRGDIVAMPSQTYDNVWMPGDLPPGHGRLLTSDQCLGCHDAGSTGLHFDMTLPDSASGKLANLSPYATWRTSPMGLAGRDPIFFAQLASETQSFHPDKAELVEGVCLGCHGVLGERQAQIDSHAASGECAPFTRADVAAIPGSADDSQAARADYGALARDGISCMVCHEMTVGPQASTDNAATDRNACAVVRQNLLNPDATGFARTFTGSFLLGPGDRINGPFAEPKTSPMEKALGISPVHDPAIKSSEVCGTCHVVHLPVLHRGQTVGHVYEQTTYAEWAFSAYRNGNSPWGKLPEGAGAKAGQCVDCHMPSGGLPKSKIASIQEHSNFPQAEFGAPPEAIDLETRDGFAQHVLVGLNSFLVRIARQFPDILGLAASDPMLGDKGVAPVALTERRIYESAANDVAAISLRGVHLDGEALRATVRIDSKVGHKFPSGVGFRRAFVAFEVLDASGAVLWASGRTDGVGRIVGADGVPIAGEQWWGPGCTRIAPGERRHQPHFQSIARQDQAQIYQELVSTPPDTGTPSCGHDVSPAGELTTSFLSICAEVKDNRLLPEGYLPLAARRSIARALGAGDDLAEDAGSTAIDDDPDYRSGGGDSLEYIVPRAALSGTPAKLRARLYYQATPPFFLQDRFCTAEGSDTDRLYWLAGHLDMAGTPAAGWKLRVADTGEVALP